jgi:hypothetical protein
MDNQGKANQENDLVQGKKIIKEICETGSPELLKTLFTLKTSHWKYWISIGEVTYGTFDDLRQSLNPSLAFSLIPTSVEIILSQTDKDLFITALSLLEGLARESNTTEIPIYLKENWKEVKQRALEIKDKDCILLLDYIETWYRHLI